MQTLVAACGCHQSVPSNSAGYGAERSARAVRGGEHDHWGLLDLVDGVAVRAGHQNIHERPAFQRIVAYCASRARTLMIERAVHLPPRADGSPRSLRALATALALWPANSDRKSPI